MSGAERSCIYATLREHEQRVCDEVASLLARETDRLRAVIERTLDGNTSPGEAEQAPQPSPKGIGSDDESRRPTAKPPPQLESGGRGGGQKLQTDAAILESHESGALGAEECLVDANRDLDSTAGCEQMGGDPPSPRLNREEDSDALVCSHEPENVMISSLAVNSKSSMYDFAMGVCIFMNAMFVGFQVNVAIENVSRKEPRWVVIVTAVFTCIFLVDLVSRLLSQGLRDFFTGTSKYLNVLDTIIVALMLFELVEWASGLDAHEATLAVLSVLLVMRMLRVTSFFNHLRVLMIAMARSWHALAGILVIMASALYIAALVGAIGAMGTDCSEEEHASLCRHFGSIGKAFRSAFMAMYGGILWGELITVLAAAHPLIASLFGFCLAFSFVIVANLVTGAIVEIVREAKSSDHESMIAQEMRRSASNFSALTGAFMEIDINETGAISKDELMLAAKDQRMASLLSALKLDLTDVPALFALLDTRRSGAVSIDDFVEGCLRLSGEARAVHFQVVREDVQNLENRLKRLDEKLFPSRRQDNKLPSGQCGRSSVESPKSSVRRPQRLSSVGTRGLSDHFLGERGRIDPAELRAMSLDELKGIWQCAQARCEQEGWVDPVSGKDLAPEEVNLYTISYNHICPLGCNGWVALTGLDLEQVDLQPGVEVKQLCADGRWALPMAVGVVVEGNDGQLLINVSRGRFEATISTGNRVLVGGVDCGVPAEVRPQSALSYKELISDVPLAPEWFCSHWWGERVVDFVRNCIMHAKYRESSTRQTTPSYWVCGYANRQYELSADLDVDPENSSFNRAMMLSKGTLIQLDDRATPFSRIWCSFEIYRTLKTEKTLDMATVVRSGSKSRAHLLSDGTMPRESSFDKMQREREFPISLLVRGLRARLEDGQSTIENDRRRIMATILRMSDKKDRQPKPTTSSSSATASTPSLTSEMDPLLVKELDRINRMLHGYFARAAWPEAVRRGMVNDFDQQNPKSLELPQVLSSDVTLKNLTLSLAHIPDVNDGTLQALSKGLPCNLLELRLSFEGCLQVGDAGVSELASRLPSGLKTLKLDFLGCRALTDRSVREIARSLPNGLVELRIDCANCPQLTAISVDALRTSLPSTLREFEATFIGTGIGRDYESVAELRGTFHHALDTVGNKAKTVQSGFVNVFGRRSATLNSEKSS